ncbi:mycothiol transferase [Nocardioides pinisoli]|uniref:DinB family protein n=1 Tax=Nocardioides pinisoli TaxID=2950279 RepID=A0ABT1KVX5_9ACTN|nr:DUF664 domain-containing protein [Nocardioides pinisoli]MCP3421923.1 DinB family protein [Nocardioides pinisoli]
MDGLTEQQARRSLVPSKTTLLGLVKHATFVEKAWFDEAVTLRSRDELGIPAGPDEYASSSWTVERAIDRTCRDPRVRSCDERPWRSSDLGGFSVRSDARVRHRSGPGGHSPRRRCRDRRLRGARPTRRRP